MKRKSLAMEGLRGPHAGDAAEIVRLALTLTPVQAQSLSDMWELDTHPDYLSYCSAVSKGLAANGRTLPLGWFEATFADVPWLDGTKALHAIADAVMATLALDLVAAPITHALLKPWNLMVGIPVVDEPFLLNEVLYT
jgi:hypothetical protein